VAVVPFFLPVSAFLMAPFLHDFVIYMHTHAHGKREVFTFTAHVPRMFGTSPAFPTFFSFWPGQKAVLIGKCHEKKWKEENGRPTCDYLVLHTLRRRLGSRETICNRAISFELPQQLPPITDSHMANNRGNVGKKGLRGGS